VADRLQFPGAEGGRLMEAADLRVAQDLMRDLTLILADMIKELTDLGVPPGVAWPAAVQLLVGVVRSA